jgi:hypothetical protein
MSSALTFTTLPSLAREAFEGYITQCPAAQSLIGCISIKDELQMEGLNS